MCDCSGEDGGRLPGKSSGIYRRFRERSAGERLKIDDGEQTRQGEFICNNIVLIYTGVSCSISILQSWRGMHREVIITLCVRETERNRDDVNNFSTGIFISKFHIQLLTFGD